MRLNKPYLNQVKQELVNDVAQSKYIVPELIILTGDYITPTLKPSYIDIKVALKRERRKKISQIYIDYPENPYPKVQEYLEQEVYNFLEAFPKYKGILFKEILL